MEAIWEKIKHFFITESHEIIAFLKPWVQSIEKNGGQILLTAATNAVAVGFSAEGDGSAKMTAALAAFSTELTDKELPYIESQARALIEVALQNARAAIS